MTHPTVADRPRQAADAPDVPPPSTGNTVEPAGPGHIVAVSGSDTSRPATAVAAELANTLDARLTILHIVAPLRYRVGRLASTLPITEQVDDPLSNPPRARQRDSAHHAHGAHRLLLRDVPVATNGLQRPRETTAIERQRHSAAATRRGSRFAREEAMPAAATALPPFIQRSDAAGVTAQASSPAEPHGDPGRTSSTRWRFSSWLR